jgi:hypothetical protein
MNLIKEAKMEIITKGASYFVSTIINYIDYSINYKTCSPVCNEQSMSRISKTFGVAKHTLHCTKE